MRDWGEGAEACALLWNSLTWGVCVASDGLQVLRGDAPLVLDVGAQLVLGRAPQALAETTPPVVGKAPPYGAQQALGDGATQVFNEPLPTVGGGVPQFVCAGAKPVVGRATAQPDVG